jgi:hypothetical protein
MVSHQSKAFIRFPSIISRAKFGPFDWPMLRFGPHKFRRGTGELNHGKEGQGRPV